MHAEEIVGNWTRMVRPNAVAQWRGRLAENGKSCLEEIVNNFGAGNEYC